MLDLLRKGVLAGIGAIVVTKEKVQETMRALADEGKISTEEAEKVAEDLVKSGERQWEEINTRIQSSMKKWASSSDLARRKELLELQARVEILEQRLNDLGAPAEKKAE
jgi:polyhydroxyalkanoate synthesis regulator phasin